MPRASSAWMMSRTPSRRRTSSPSSRVPLQRVLSRSHTRHLTLRRLAGATALPEDSLLIPISLTNFSPGYGRPVRNFLAGALRNRDLLDLIASFNDFHNLGVSIKAFYWIFAAASVCAVYLNCIPGNLRRGPAGEVFGNRSLNHRGWITGILELSGVVTEQTGCLHANHHVRDHALDQLVVLQESAELLSLSCVLQARFQTCLGNAYTAPGHTVAAAIQG